MELLVGVVRMLSDLRTWSEATHAQMSGWSRETVCGTRYRGAEVRDGAL